MSVTTAGKKLVRLVSGVEVGRSLVIREGFKPEVPKAEPEKAKVVFVRDAPFPDFMANCEEAILEWC